MEIKKNGCRKQREKMDEEADWRMICYLSWIEPTFTGGKAMSNILIMKPITK
jgi:hypothetical protein